jgi:GDPmannose 4,6-dehydratase
MIIMSKQKTALITGIHGQDGFYLAEILAAKGYHVLGTSHTSAGTLKLGNNIIDVIKLDLTDSITIQELVESIRPDELYNMAARSSSSQLFDDPIETAEINGVAVVRFLEAIIQTSPHTRFCQAASSEIFAGTNSTPQNETSAITPINSYGAAKAYALHMVKMYREKHGLHASTAILFNHESPRRSEQYVTRKISKTVAIIEAGLTNSLELGNLEIRRDWGFAGDYANAMWKMLQINEGNDYIVATGEMHSIRDFCQIAFEYIGLNYLDHVKVVEMPERRVETVELRGDSFRAKQLLGWQPNINFSGLVKMMVDADRILLKNERAIK